MPSATCADSDDLRRFKKAAAKFGLSPREIETLLTLCACSAWKACAERMKISVRTVRYHVEKIRRKTGAENLAGAVWRLANF